MRGSLLPCAVVLLFWAASVSAQNGTCSLDQCSNCVNPDPWCASCPHRTAMAENNGACLPCEANCDMCIHEVTSEHPATDGFTKCLRCFVGYRMSNSSDAPATCEACDSDCQSCDQHGPTLCDVGRCNPRSVYVEETKTCEVCTSSCNKCEAEGPLKCDSGECFDRYYWDPVSKTCQACGQYCNSCGSNGAGKCDAGQCIEGKVYTEETKSCDLCSPFCASCTTRGKDKCDDGQCADPYGLDSSFICRTCGIGCTSCTANGNDRCDPDMCIPSMVYVAATQTCSLCGDHCNICVQQGPGKCDAGMCQDYYGYKADTNECQACESNCLRCDVANDGTTSCTECRPSYQLSGESNNVCDFCPDHCLRCTTIGSVRHCDTNQCESGYALNSFDGKCYLCPSNCHRCSSDSTGTTRCTSGSCHNLFALRATDGKCYPCPSNCYRCTDNGQGPVCVYDQCHPGSAFDSATGLCPVCPSNCVACYHNSAGALQCVMCEGRFTLNDDRLGCTACPENCLQCYMEDGGTKCYDSGCAEEFTMDRGNNVCMRCNSGCLACDWDEDTRTVTQCKPGMCKNDAANGNLYVQKDDMSCERCRDCEACTYTGGSVVCSSCSPGFSVNTADGCDDCPSNCDACDTTTDVCLDNRCTASTHVQIPDTRTCLACPVGCTTCDLGNLECTGCDSGMSRIGGVCIDCPPGCSSCSYDRNTKKITCDTCFDHFAENSVTDLCDACSNGCNECSSSTVCTECLPRFKLQGESCQACPNNAATCQDDFTCDDGWYPNEGDTACVVCSNGCASCSSESCTTCRPGWATITIDEIDTCEECSDDACLQCEPDGEDPECVIGGCYPGYVMNSNGDCIECDTGCAACSQVEGSNSDTTCLPGMCKLGFAESSGTCYPCPVHCLSCYYEGSAKCKSNGCARGYKHNAAGDGCEACEGGCLECTNDACLVCPAGSHITDATCTEDCAADCAACDASYNCVLCDVDFTKELATDFSCADCSGDCDQCMTAGECLPDGCADDHARDTDGVCQSTTHCTECSVCGDDSDDICLHALYCSPKFDLPTTPGACTACVDDCLICDEATAGACDICEAGFVLTGENICLACDVANCAVCDNNVAECTECEAGYFRATAISCTGCASTSNCKRCTAAGATDCYECNDGFVLAEGACTPASGCETSDADGCKSCMSGFTLDDTTCEVCEVDNCHECDQNIALCTACKPGYQMMTFGVHEILACVDCGENCAACSTTASTLTCTACSPGFFLDNNACVAVARYAQLPADSGTSLASAETCIDGFFMDSTACKPCAPHCTECAAVNECTTNMCMDGFIYSDKICKPKCQISNCNDCSVTNGGVESCSGCASGFFDDSGACTACSANCVTCGSATVCTTCEDGYGVVSNVCERCDDRHCDDCADDVSTCVASTGCATGYGNTDAVVLCIGSVTPCEIEHCTECDTSSAFICNTCEAGYQLHEDKIKCYEPCSVDYCMECNDGTCVRCNPGYKLDATNCVENDGCSGCATCGIYETALITQCFSCPDGEVLNDDETCTAITLASSNCVDGATGDPCVECQMGYGEVLDACTACETNCAKCGTDQTSCTECVSGYYLAAGNVCTACDFCTQCTVTGCTAGFCLAGYYFDTPDCKPCPIACATCTATDECTSCLDGSDVTNEGVCGCDVDEYLDGNTCRACPVVGCGTQGCDASGCIAADDCRDTFTPSDSGCLACGPNCKSCDDPGVCDVCNDGYHMVVDQCLKCSLPKCKTCPAGTCTHCIDGHQLEENVCVAVCETPFKKLGAACVSLERFCTADFTVDDSACDDVLTERYILQDTSLCRDSNCAVCAVSMRNSELECLQCDAMYYVSAAGTCTQCATGCLSCLDNGAGRCLEDACDENYRYNENADMPGYGTCEECPSNTASNLGVCSNELPSILEWSCERGYYLDSTSCAGCPTGCSICDSAGLCVEDGCGADQVQTNDVVKECVACPTNCAVCSYLAGSAENKMTCSSCDSGYVLMPDASCYPCPTSCNVCSPPDSTNQYRPVCSECEDRYALNPVDQSCHVCHGSDANEGGEGCLSCVYSPTESKVICDTQQCAEGFAQHPTTKRCIECPTGCGFCEFTAASTILPVCLSGGCLPQFYQDSLTLTCSACPSNCDECRLVSGSVECLTEQCASGFGIRDSDKFCYACSEGCLRCDVDDTTPSTTTCLECRAEFIINDGSCHACPDNCNVCTYDLVNTQTMCSILSCKTRYAQNNAADRKDCVECPSNCLVCDYNVDSSATECQSGQCASLFALNEQLGCTACAANCLACTVGNQCTTCIPGYTVDNNICARCDTNCNQCNSNGKGKCDSQTYCHSRFYYNSETTQCQACDPNCRQCSTAGSAKCDSNQCDSAYVLKPDETCTACPDNCEDCTYNIDLGKSECLVDGCENLYGHVTSDFTCKECPPTCAVCSDASGDGTMVCSECMATYVINEMQCGACPPNCAACTAESGKMRCDACVTNYVLMDDKSCEICPPNCQKCLQTSNVKRCETCDISSNSMIQYSMDSVELCKVCSTLATSNCIRCTDATSTTASKCLACAPSYTLSDDGTRCIACNEHTTNCNDCVDYAEKCDGCSAPYHPAMDDLFCGVECNFCEGANCSSNANDQKIVCGAEDFYSCWAFYTEDDGEITHRRGCGNETECTSLYQSKFCQDAGNGADAIRECIQCCTGDSCNTFILDGTASAATVNVASEWIMLLLIGASLVYKTITI